MSRAIAYFWVYVVPLPLFAAMSYAWLVWSQDWALTLYVMGLPVLYGYVAPGIATNLLHKWRFKGPWVVGSYYAHHGFKYAATMSPLLLLSFLGTPREPLSLATTTRVLLCTGALNAFVVWLHDILLVRHGMLEVYNAPAAQGQGPEAIVTHYAPPCFFLIGLAYAAAALLAYQTFVVHHQTGAGAIIRTSLIGIALLFSIPSLAYRALERKSK